MIYSGPHVVAFDDVYNFNKGNFPEISLSLQVIQVNPYFWNTQYIKRNSWLKIYKASDSLINIDVSILYLITSILTNYICL